MGQPITEYKEVRCNFPCSNGEIGTGNPDPGEMYVYLEGETPHGVRYRCPCGCDNVIYTLVCTGEKIEHHWLFSRGPNGVTLSPSIRWICGCQWHFNIEDGKVIVHADAGK